ncbi:ABC transporter permease [Cohnella lupini]|uniref:Transport permease protein n=1 Tax=Cohnella lupini TaxID=1294267 RepID=A0A3D9I791_9BACL|nr:lipopolysaccharide transport system permease protein [Cohnella lupini]
MLYMMWDMVKRDFRNKYAGSVLGLLWNLLLPIGYIIIYTTVFSKLMSAKIPNMTNSYDYSVFLSSGILAWTVFSNTIIRFQNIFIENSNIVKKIYFPKSILLYSLALSSIIELIINYMLLAIILAVVGYPLHLSYAFVLVLIILMQVFCLGIGKVLSILNVHFRDLSQFISITLPILFWLTPIVYFEDILPKYMIKIVEYNPIAYMIKAFQSIILYSKIEHIYLIAIIAIATYFLGSIFYKKMINEVSDLI